MGIACAKLGEKVSFGVTLQPYALPALLQRIFFGFTAAPKWCRVDYVCTVHHAICHCVVDSQFARIRKLNGFERIRPGYARLLDIVQIALLVTASPAARIRNSH